ncbi:MAG: ABC transporter ATP-binding protein [Candidatus Promineifilaceae bacterium]|nr:ABC transporter ATP-binding protein [Candidatus Promineifilaceae bacterium]
MAETKEVVVQEVVVHMEGVTKRFGDVAAVSDVTLQVPQGSIFGFIGPSGCGKTTTVRLLIGNYGLTEGQINVLGRTPEKFGRDDQKRIGYMPQLFILYPELTVWENLNFAASIYGYPLDRKKRLRELLDLVELTGHEKKMVRNISGGMQRRLSLAATLIHDPDLIFLDEPTAGIDPVLRRKFWDHFQILKERGHTLFVTTQYVGEAAYCDYVGVMRKGELLMVETPEMLRYKAMGGHVVILRTLEPMPLEAIVALEDHTLTKGEVTFRDPLTARLTVEDASKAIPQLLDWCDNFGVMVESINEFVPPFDDVFVMIMEQQGEQEEESEL